VTLPYNYEESGSPKFKFGKERNNENSELNMDVNYIGHTFNDINDNNPFFNKKSNNHHNKNKSKALNSNNSSNNNFYDSEMRLVKTSSIDYNSDLIDSKSCFPEKINVKTRFKLKNEVENNNNLYKDSSVNEIQKINLEKFSKKKMNAFKYDQISIMKESLENKRIDDLKTLKNSLDSVKRNSEKDKFIMNQKINDSADNYIKKKLQNYLNNNNLNSINLVDMKKLINPIREIEGISNKITSENHNNKEEIKQLLKEIYNKKDKKTENKLRRNFLYRDTDTFYTKLSDYKLNVFSERNGSSNLDEKYCLKRKLNPHLNRFYATNNTYENNLLTSNEFPNKNFSKIEYIKPQNNNNKNLLDITKRLLSKNSFDYVCNLNTNKDIDKHNLRKVSDDYQNNLYKNKENDRFLKDYDIKNSMIVINNNIKINTFIDNHTKHNYLLENKNNNNYNNYDNRYSSNINDNTNLEFILSHKKELPRKKHELDYNYNLYSNDLKNVENKKDYKNNDEILETDKRINVYKTDHRNNDIHNDNKYSHLNSKITVFNMNKLSSHYNRSLDFLSKDKYSMYNNISNIYSHNPIREKYFNKY